MILLRAIIFILATCSGTYAQMIEWQNTIGGSGADVLYSIQQTSDGGFILGGYSNSTISGDKADSSNGNFDYWIVKTDSLGTIQWQHTIGGSGYEQLRSIKQTSDGGYILGGFSDSNISADKTENSLGGHDYWIVKTDSSGTIQWQNTIGGNNADQLFSIEQTAEGGYIFGGRSASGISGDKTEPGYGFFDYWIVKTDSSGVIQWQNTIWGNESDYLYSIEQTSDGGYILGGVSNSNISGDKTENSNGHSDYWIVKTDALGSIQWQNTIGGNASDVLNSIHQTADSGYILGGHSVSGISGDKTESGNGDFDYWIVKTDSSGNIQWQNTLGGSGKDQLWSLEQTFDGGYILGGSSTSDVSGDKTENSMGGYDYWIVKTDALGSIQWQNTIGGDSTENLFSVYQTADEGYILGGHSYSENSGDKTENSNGIDDFWIVKISTLPVSLIEPTAFDNLLLYPNPANSTLTIETGNLSDSDCRLIISDVAGRTLFSKVFTTTSTKQEIDISSFSQGIYFVNLQGGERISRGRFVKE